MLVIENPVLVSLITFSSFYQTESLALPKLILLLIWLIHESVKIQVALNLVPALLHATVMIAGLSCKMGDVLSFLLIPLALCLQSAKYACESLEQMKP